MINDVVESHVEFYKGFNLTFQINSSVCHTSTDYQSYTKPHMEAVLSLPPADVPLHCFQKYSLHGRKWQHVYYEAIYRNSSIKGYWCIRNSDEVSDLVSEANSKGNVTSIKTYDFSTLYTNLPHTELEECIPKLVII